MNGRQHLLEIKRDVRLGGAKIIMIEERANHTLVTLNAHGRVCRAVVPRGHVRQDGHSWQNSRASLRRQLRLLPGEAAHGGHHAR